jgi:phosphoribosylanthranilate isomerase
MRVKVCGITQEEQLVKLHQVGVTFAGLIFYPKSQRYVLRHMTTSQIKKENNVNKVGVFVNASIEEVLQMVDECRLHMVQLHGDETPRYCEKIADYISVVKAFRVSESDNIGWRIKDYMDVCDMFMFDTEGAGYGGTGKKFDWNKLKEVTVGKPYFLSGGIEPGDVQRLKDFEKSPEAKALFAIDINSRFETIPGIKDLDLVKKFIQELQ